MNPNQQTQEMLEEALEKASGDPVELKELADDYKQEREDPHHRSSVPFMRAKMDMMREYFEAGVRGYANFEEWLNGLTVFEARKILFTKLRDELLHSKLKGGEDASSLTSQEQAYLTREASEYASAIVNGVEYLSEKGRSRYALDIVDGKLKNTKGAWLSTKWMETNFSGAGWAIWVLSADDVLYCASHRVNSFHHSSFLSGDAVQGAGELKVEDGHVKLISSKTGHYQCDIRIFIKALRKLMLMGLDLNVTDAIVLSKRAQRNVAVRVPKLISVGACYYTSRIRPDRANRQVAKPRLEGAIGQRKAAFPSPQIPDHQFYKMIPNGPGANRDMMIGARSNPVQQNVAPPNHRNPLDNSANPERTDNIIWTRATKTRPRTVRFGQGVVPVVPDIQMDQESNSMIGQRGQTIANQDSHVPVQESVEPVHTDNYVSQYQDSLTIEASSSPSLDELHAANYFEPAPVDEFLRHASNGYFS